LIVLETKTFTEKFNEKYDEEIRSLKFDYFDDFLAVISDNDDIELFSTKTFTKIQIKGDLIKNEILSLDFNRSKK
jgi:WD40 repeat protein